MSTRSVDLLVLPLLALLLFGHYRTAFAGAVSTTKAGEASEQPLPQPLSPLLFVAGGLHQCDIATTTTTTTTNNVAADEMPPLCDRYCLYDDENNNDDNDDDDDTIITTVSLSSPSSLYHHVTSLSSATILLLLVSFYLTATLLYSMIAWYKFVSAWNLILRVRQFDHSIQLRRRRCPHHRRHNCCSSSSRSSHKLTMMQQQQQQVVDFDTMSKHNLTCPICLVDFFETELVTACGGDDNDYDNDDGGGGCGNWFHRACLVEWLDRSDSCPCCRKNLLFRQHQTRPRINNNNNMADVVRSCFGFVTR